jgi:hypothetical protein
MRFQQHADWPSRDQWSSQENEQRWAAAIVPKRPVKASSRRLTQSDPDRPGTLYQEVVDRSNASDHHEKEKHVPRTPTACRARSAPRGVVGSKQFLDNLSSACHSISQDEPPNGSAVHPHEPRRDEL